MCIQYNKVHKINTRIKAPRIAHKSLKLISIVVLARVKFNIVNGKIYIM